MVIVLAPLAACAPPEPLWPVEREPVLLDQDADPDAGTGTGDAGGGAGGTGDDGGTGGTGGPGGDHDPSYGGDEGGGDVGGDGDNPHGDYFEGWPSTGFFTPYCGDCHPHLTSNGWDWANHDHVREQYDHIYCGVNLVETDECGGHHVPGHLPQGGGAMPTEDERLRLIAWMDAGIPRLEDLE
jgi:hypothetical protein